MDREVRDFGVMGKGHRFRENHILKNVKALHILSAIAWGGGAFSMQAMHLMRTMHTDPSIIRIIASCSYFVDTWVVMPGLLGCIVTGLFYSVVTSFGFFRFLWIIYKWLITLNACFWGLLFWSNAGDMLIEWLTPYKFQAPLILMRSLILPDSIGVIAIQTLVILSMCLISVYRPLGWWHKYCILDNSRLPPVARKEVH